MTEIDQGERNTSSASRLPVVIVLDTSAQMNENGRVQALNEALFRLKEELTCNDLLCKHVDLSVVTCGQDVSVLYNFVNPQDFVAPTLTGGGPCLMVAGLLKGLAIIEQRKAEYRKTNQDYYSPCMIMIGGTEPDDFSCSSKAFAESINAVKKDVTEGTLYFSPILVDVVGHEDQGLINACEEEETLASIIEMYVGLSSSNFPLKRLDRSFSFSELISTLYMKDDFSMGNHLSQEYPRTDTQYERLLTSIVSDDARTGMHTILGASVMGPLHVTYGIPCQDAIDYAVLDSRHSIIAIADGLGSNSKSEIGSRIAVEASTKYAKDFFEKTPIVTKDLEILARDCISDARRALEQKAGQLQCKLRDLACTIIVVVIEDDKAAVAHIGDGAVLIQAEDGLRLLSEPGQSEYANEVQPITGSRWENYVRISRSSGVKGVMAFTDGCQRAALKKTKDGYVPFEGFCEPLFTFAAETRKVQEANKDIEEFLLSRKMSDNSEDDKTLAIIVVNPKAPGEKRE